MKAPVAENRADLKNVARGNECFLRTNVSANLTARKESFKSRINSYKRRYFYRGVFALLFGLLTGIIKPILTLLYALRKDINNASVRSFTHCTKISISCVKWVISWNCSTLSMSKIRTWRVGQCQSPFVRCGVGVRKTRGLDTSCAAYQGNPGLWYLTARGFN